MATPGTVYTLTNNITGRLYLGRTKAPKRREYMHFWLLSGGRHPNPALQADYVIHGRDAFTYQTLYETEDPEAAEQRELDARDLSIMYNVSPHAKGGDHIKLKPLAEQAEIYARLSASRLAQGLKPPNCLPCYIQGQAYPSYHAASRDLGVHLTVVRYRCLSRNAKFINWERVKGEKSKGNLYQDGDRQGIAIVGEGTRYVSYAEAARDRGLSITAIINRVRSTNFPEWQREGDYNPHPHIAGKVAV